MPEKWNRIDLDVTNAEQLAGAMEKVAETLRVTPDEARALGQRPGDEAGHEAAPQAGAGCS